MTPARFLLRSMMLLGAWLLAGALAAEPPAIAGEVPADVPDGAVVAAWIVSDAGSAMGDPVARAVVADGRFELTLPAEIDAGLLETERLGCDEDELVELAYLPFLVVLHEGEPVGRLVLTDVPQPLWSFGFPPKHAYWLYAAEPFAAEGACRGGEVAVAIEPGWNPVLVIQGPDGMSFTTEPAPEAFTWHYAPER